MIYLIDDKISRQKGYGWTDEEFENFKGSIIRVVGENNLKELLSQIIAPGNVILVHDSFLNGKSDVFDKFKSTIKNTPELQVCLFSGSNCGRCVEGRVAYLSPYLVYTNLETFINKHNNNDTNFQYLAFGENIGQEKELKNIYYKFVNNSKNTSYISRFETQKRIAYFATAGEYEILSPFKTPSIKKWDFPSNRISFQDIDFEKILEENLKKEKFDIIYLPLCFGRIFSDYLGLRLAMYIRFSQSCNQNTPIVLYSGISRTIEIIGDECFDALKLPNIKLVGLDYDQIIQTEKEEYSEIEMSKFDLKHINIQLPQKYNDNHDVSNIWSIHRWHSMFDWGTNIPKIIDSDLTKSLYFKYLEMKYGVHDKFKKNKKKSPFIPSFNPNKHIVYIDDDHNKGWGEILKTIFKNSNVAFDIFDRFDKNISKTELRELLVNFVENNDADCYILGIKLHSDDFLDNSTKPLGLEIAEKIKELNQGNQILFFTASKNIEDYKKALNDINAAGYILKEAPFDNYSTKDTELSYFEFTQIVRNVCNNKSFLREFYSKQKELKNKNEKASNELDSIGNLLTLYSEVSNESTQANRTKQDLLGAILLFELNYFHDFIIALDFHLQSEGPQKKLTKLQLCNKSDTTYSKELLGHLFCKRKNGQNGHVVIEEMSKYYEASRKPDSGWSELIEADLTLDVSFLRIVMNVTDEIIQDYLKWRNIRNTQIAHNNSNENTLKVDDILKFYNQIIVPVIERFS